jgi:GT2 family glycosyltransferase
MTGAASASAADPVSASVSAPDLASASVSVSDPVSAPVTVAIPVRDGGELLRRTLEALAGQSVAHELLVCDSGSRDRSVALAKAHGARVIEIGPEEFSHGGTRNLLMGEARGEHVALLTQDAEPASGLWLEHLLGGFAAADDVGLVYGPYVPRPGASAAVKAEIEGWFRSLSPDGELRVERLSGEERALSGAALLARADADLAGRRGFFTDANACIARAAWQAAPFREVAYAEDRLLALDMLRAGHAKVFVPEAAVVHSHDYTALEQFRRCFDEWRGLREVYGLRESANPRHLAGRLRRAPTLHNVVRQAGALLGSRADRLPPGLRRRLSLEGREGFAPVDLDR